MMYVNRDAVGLPDLYDACLAQLGTVFADARIKPFEEIGPVRAVYVYPEASPSFGVRFYSPEMIGCDGTEEQTAAVGLLLAGLARNQGVQIVALSDDASEAHAVDEDDTVATVMDRSAWVEIDPNRLGQGDILATTHSFKDD